MRTVSRSTAGANTDQRDLPYPPPGEPAPGPVSDASPASPTMATGSTSRRSRESDLVYVGSSRGLERQLVPRTGIGYILFPMAPPQSVRGVALQALAMARCVALILRARPRVTFATGGYVSAPAAVASWLLRVPVVLFLPDVVPGRAVAWLVPLARRSATVSDA